MAAFSSSTSSSPFHHHHPFLLDSSLFLPNSNSTIHHHNNNHQHHPLLLHQSPNTNIAEISNFINHPNLIQNPDPNNNTSTNNSSSIVTDYKHESSEQLTQNLITPMEKKRKSSANSAQSKDKREVKLGKKQKKIKEDEEKKNNNSKENKVAEGYIHVRARRGQATDSHSLAERVRRERISERMKLLQALVPGCDKLHVVLCGKQVTGKALMLDEIINYVQSLQNQVEFLSMKLASVNPMFYDFGVDLESFMVRPDQDLSELPSPLTSMQECSPTTANNYNFMENSANPILFQQSVLSQPQGSRQTLWEVDEHRQKIINQSGFNNSLFSFH